MCNKSALCCTLCNSESFLAKNTNIDYIEFHQVLPSSTIHHVHKATIYYFSTNTPRKVIFKRITRLRELEVLNVLERLFSSDSKPHMSLLDFIQFKENNVTIMILERGKLDLHSFRIQSDILIPSNITTAILKSLIEKVNMIHTKGLAHLDLSIENVLLSNKQAFLIDFENARFLSFAEDFHFNTESKPKSNVGKIAFMSSDQYHGRAWNGFQADVFAIGVIAFWLFFATMPFVSHKSRECRLLQSERIEEVVLYFGSPFCDDLSNNQTRLALSFIGQCCAHSSVRPRCAAELLTHELFNNI